MSNEPRFPSASLPPYRPHLREIESPASKTNTEDSRRRQSRKTVTRNRDRQSPETLDSHRRQLEKTVANYRDSHQNPRQPRKTDTVDSHGRQSRATETITRSQDNRRRQSPKTAPAGALCSSETDLRQLETQDTDHFLDPSSVTLMNPLLIC